MARETWHKTAEAYAAAAARLESTHHRLRWLSDALREHGGTA
jgi:hypothetical protein